MVEKGRVPYTERRDGGVYQKWCKLCGRFLYVRETSGLSKIVFHANKLEDDACEALQYMTDGPTL